MKRMQLQEFDLGSLADPDAHYMQSSTGDLPTDLLLSMYDKMVEIRLVERAIAEMVETGEARCPCHLAIGQEACAVGVAKAFTADDRAFGAHRSHGHYLALGGDVFELFAEILGRAQGCSRGMGGSMHLIDQEHGLLGTVPIVGATIPMAVGAALAAKMNGKGVAVAFFGDGATEEGVFHESLNLAQQLTVPAVFVCENNLFASHLHIRQRQPADSVSRFAWANQIHAQVVDGNDAIAVLRAAQTALEYSRSSGRPSFLELVTYRWLGHVGHREDLDVGVQRKDDLPQWKARDPIRRLADLLIADGRVKREELDQRSAALAATIQAALEQARLSPYPHADATLEYVYAEGNNA